MREIFECEHCKYVFSTTNPKFLEHQNRCLTFTDEQRLPQAREQRNKYILDYNKLMNEYDKKAI